MRRWTKSWRACRASRAAVTRLTAGVADGLVSARAVLTDVEALEGAGRRIGKIVDALDVVAVQTTMLAVSGSVEAARAGDLGQGFALVSTDIRNLARNSSENAERIEDLVQIIQDQVSTVRRDLDQLVAILDKEVQANAILDDRLAEVETSAVSLRATNEDIARSADAISASVSEVASGNAADCCGGTGDRHCLGPGGDLRATAVAGCRRPRRGRRGNRPARRGTARSRGAEVAQSGQKAMLSLRVGAEDFSTAAEDVTEVLRQPRLTRVPLAPAGVLKLQPAGRVVPVVSLACALGEKAGQLTSRSRVLVLRLDDPIGVARWMP